MMVSLLAAKMVRVVVAEGDRKTEGQHDDGSDFNPTDAAGLAAWFARAEANAPELVAIADLNLQVVVVDVVLAVSRAGARSLLGPHRWIA
jgi:hypothetical protein